MPLLPTNHCFPIPRRENKNVQCQPMAEELFVQHFLVDNDVKINLEKDTC